MGMTDRQFDTYQESLLRELKRVRKELQEQGIKNETLEDIIQSFENQLKRP